LDERLSNRWSSGLCFSQLYENVRRALTRSVLTPPVPIWTQTEARGHCAWRSDSGQKKDSRWRAGRERKRYVRAD
jgi:hypothetical protein